jgi:hypothetical protein
VQQALPVGMQPKLFNRSPATTRRRHKLRSSARHLSARSLFNIAGRFFWASLSDKRSGRKLTYFTFFTLGFIGYAAAPTLATLGMLGLFAAAFQIAMTAEVTPFCLVGVATAGSCSTVARCPSHS